MNINIIAGNVGYADMMQISVSHVPYPVAVQPVPVQVPQVPQMSQMGPMQLTQVPQNQQTQFHIQGVYNPFETKK
jgi:hypothetical protein